jgi:hypothetical protein
MFHPASLVVILFIPSIYQYYDYAITRPKYEREQPCYGFGITYISFGVASLISRDAVLVFFGFFLIMLGMLLLAKGLDRKDKTIFIDQYQEDQDTP